MSVPPLNVGDVRCPKHPEAGVLTRLISKTSTNPNRAFYKCNIDAPKCTYFGWEDELPALSVSPPTSQPRNRPLSPPATPNRKRPAESDLGPSAKRPPPASPAAQARLNTILRAQGLIDDEAADSSFNPPAIPESPSPSPSTSRNPVKSGTLPSWLSSSPSAPPPTTVRTEDTRPLQSGSGSWQSDTNGRRTATDSSLPVGILPSGSRTASGGSDPRGPVASYSLASADAHLSADDSNRKAAYIQSLERSLQAAEKINDAYLFKIQCLSKDLEELRAQLYPQV
ncbi:hypothetical protein C8F01DRAFT_231456 [Mycena amicta]|nr:hypothetical protein C8F01DRAFT_231456 [Mycena amicta]